MQKRKIVCFISAVAICGWVQTQAEPVAGTYELTGDQAGNWQEIFLGGNKNAVGNPISAEEPGVYTFTNATLVSVAVDTNGVWSSIKVYTNGTLTLLNVEEAPWANPCDDTNDGSLTFEFESATLKTRANETNAQIMEFELSATSDYASFTAVYSGVPTVNTNLSGDTILSGELTSVTITFGFEVDVDVKPGSPINPVNVRSKGVLPVAIYGSEEVAVKEIDPETLTLNCVAPIRWAYEDINGDDLLDLTLKFDTQAIVATFPDDVANRSVETLVLLGELKNDGAPISGSDDVLVLVPPGHGPAKPPGKPPVKPGKPLEKPQKQKKAEKD